MTNIISPPAAEGASRANVDALEFVVSRMVPGLWAPILPGESFVDVITRREAARDILDDLLAEYADWRALVLELAAGGGR